ncbi:MAG TPA: glycosyltransferase [Gemmataceae bacterium]|nr:glycosyltransferase [Gemmataceae bacterium]
MMSNGVVQKPPRILVLSASVGAGHMRAAEAVELALRETAPDAFVRNLDVLEMTNHTFRRIYSRAYLGLMNRAPHIHGYFYDLFDRPVRAPITPTDRLRIVVERFNLGRFIRFLLSEPWDLVVNTHFLPAEIIASLRRQGKLDLPQVTVTTDFDTHRMWVHSPCEHYFTATEEGAQYLQYCGVPAEDATVTGIPIHPVFRAPKDRAACAAKHGLATDRPVVLQMAGGFGVVGPIEPMHAALLRTKRPIELVTAVGRNAALQARLEKIPTPPRHRARVLAFTREIDEFMAAADLVVSKPGGLTVAETLARGTVLVMVQPVPGQESRNSDYLLENGAAVKANNLPQLVHKVEALLADADRLARMRVSSARLSRPNAAFDVAERAMRFIRKGERPA